MRKNVFGRKFKRTVDQRRQLFKGLLSSLVLNERIETTEQKAKAIKGQFDKLVTKTKKHGEAAKSRLAIHLTPDAMEKMVTILTPRLTKRTSGYTRIVRLGRRMTDSASMAIIELVDKELGVVAPQAKVAKPQKEKKVEKVEEVKKPVAKKPVVKKAAKTK